LLIRGGNSEQATSAVRAAVAALDREQPVFDVVTMERALHDDLANNYILMGILIALAGIALLLAAAGIYGVIAYTVAQRTAEIGLRMALGASSTTILKMVLRRGLALLLPGGGFGLIGGYLLGRLMSGFLYQVAPPTRRRTFQYVRSCSSRRSRDVMFRPPARRAWIR
jgi:ABC-type antimicrobial peptide transport system permease subunit